MFLSPKMEPKRIKLEDLRVKEFKLPLRNKKGEIVAYTLVDEDDFEKFKNEKFSLSDGYAHNKKGRLHRLITGAKKGEIVDHINGDRLDNRKENLRIVTAQENNRNRAKINNASSNYHGVYFCVRDQTWGCHVSVDGKSIRNSFKNEIHAAYWRDVLVQRYYLTGTKLNGLEKPMDFIEPQHKVKNLPIGIRKTSDGKFQSSIYLNSKSIHLGTFKTAEEAEDVYLSKKSKLNKLLLFSNQLTTQPIKRNQDGIAIIELFNKKKEKVGDCLVDDNKYYILVQFTWCLSYGGYVNGRIGKQQVQMHRYLMGATPGCLVDHINHNRADNRMHNLRFSTPGANSHNKIKQSNKTSQYYGVSFDKSRNNYRATININHTYINVGRFKDELEAAKAYDEKAKELYGSYANLNFP